MATSNALGLRPNLSIIPLISSSLTLFYAVVESTIFEAFLRAAETDPQSTNRTLRLWWNNYLPYGLCTIFGVTIPSAATAIYALRKVPQESSEFVLYTAGAAFSLGHFLFVPSITKVIEALCSEDVEARGETANVQKKWLKLHGWRTVLMDVPAWLCFAWLVFGM